MTNLPRAAGRAVAVPLGALARRRGGKPMHPRGAVLDAVLDRRGSEPGWGIPWLDEPAAAPAVVRLSRGAGLPEPWPDLLGLAVRIPGDRPVDLLLSSAGRGRLTRFLPALRRDAAATYCSIMGYRSVAGTLRLAAVPAAAPGPVPSDPEPLAEAVAARPLAFDLLAARGLGAWRPFARLTLTGHVPSLDPDVAFDAVRRPPPGLMPDGPMARFRAPSYAAARQGRGRAVDPDRGEPPGP